jgi:hypothetical protein
MALLLSYRPTYLRVNYLLFHGTKFAYRTAVFSLLSFLAVS